MLCLEQIGGCQTCGGDLSIECDIHTVYAECKQCGVSWIRDDLVLEYIQNTIKSTNPLMVKSPGIVEY